MADVAQPLINSVGVLFMGSVMLRKNSDHLRRREVLKGPLCQTHRGKHAGQMWPSAKIQITPLKGCLI